jgi:hypothetical protein
MSRAEYDGSGWGVGPPMPWSHYTYGDSRCDARPVLRQDTREYVCPVPGCLMHNRCIMTEHEAAYRRLLNFARPFDPDRDYESVPIEGYVQTGPNSYERIGDIDEKAAYARLMRQSSDYYRKGGR